MAVVQQLQLTGQCVAVQLVNTCSGLVIKIHVLVGNYPNPNLILQSKLMTLICHSIICSLSKNGTQNCNLHSITQINLYKKLGHSRKHPY